MCKNEIFLIGLEADRMTCVAVSRGNVAACRDNNRDPMSHMETLWQNPLLPESHVQHHHNYEPSHQTDRRQIHVAFAV